MNNRLPQSAAPSSLYDSPKLVGLPKSGINLKGEKDGQNAEALRTLAVLADGSWQLTKMPNGSEAKFV